MNSTQPRFPLDHTESRLNFRYFATIPLRWIDNDQYGHLNNARYYSLYEHTIMYYLEVEHGLPLNDGPTRCFTAENGCRYHAPAKYPGTATIGLRAAHLGRSSVRYELGLFMDDSSLVAATGFSVEIFVDAVSERPTPIPSVYRAVLNELVQPPTVVLNKDVGIKQ